MVSVLQAPLMKRPTAAGISVPSPWLVGHGRSSLAAQGWGSSRGLTGEGGGEKRWERPRQVGPSLPMLCRAYACLVGHCRAYGMACTKPRGGQVSCWISLLQTLPQGERWACGLKWTRLFVCRACRVKAVWKVSRVQAVRAVMITKFIP